MSRPELRVAPRAVLVTILALMATMSIAMPASACEAGGGEIVSGVEIDGTCEDDELVFTGGGGEPIPPENKAFEPVWGTQPTTGEPCIDWVIHVYDGAGMSEQAFWWEQLALRMVADPRVQNVANRWCQGIALPGVAAREFVHRIPIPDPALEVAPGYAVTGLEAYLVIGGQEAWVENGTITMTDGSTAPIRVVFTPYEHVVDWDGPGPLPAETHTSTGVAHPGGPGEITHVYATAGERTVTSVHRWRAEWSVLGFSGVVSPIEMNGTLDLGVEQVQAVRDR